MDWIQLTDSQEEFQVPDGYYYTREHEWVKKTSEGTVKIGITDYAAKMLHDVVYVTLPSDGTEFNAKDVFGQVESVKTVSDIYMPVSGKIIRTNETLTRTPESVSNSPYDEGWMLEVQAKQVDAEISQLLNPKEYRAFIEELKKSEA